ncbi:diaminopimelate decarboxylase [Hwanghaeella grinnelliae]|uniref:Diaminopimelate decarboxylase n=1 Tax=Hwanghaeella grinnelliae TaxID=2500179 RepID=A0A3S2Z7R7_9PROT|nr:diaminopimelate decarboxylase [Hwanghaeella grinnelliae]RVU36617.1 diaminopimelate decarboxylase [Hwanghaeella grinnelliae]
MDHFNYRNGTLHAEDVPLSEIASAVGTPVYVYSTATLRRHYKVFTDAFAGARASVFYAVKANSNLAVLKTLGDMGAGADVVSEGELRRALAAGIPPSRIVFSGVGKTAEELIFALDTGILEINVESVNELELLNTVAGERGKVAEIAIRVNPDVDAKTHHKISTGKKENKFGIDIAYALDIFKRAQAMPNLAPVTVAAHIGSQLTDLEPYRAAFQRLADLVRELRAEGIPIHRVDLGGGLGVPYAGETPPLPDAYAAVAREIIEPLDVEMLFEPGRMIVGNAGILLAKVLFVKQGESRRFVVVDAAMNDLIRPAMYDGYHGLKPVIERPEGTPMSPADIVGPICESGDTFAKERPLPLLNDGELVAFTTAGAYGAVMASTYNSRPLVPEVLVDGDRFAVIRPRQTYEEMLGADRIPDWLSGPGEQAVPKLAGMSG